MRVLRPLAAVLVLAAAGCGTAGLGGGRPVGEVFPDTALAACVAQAAGVPSADSLVTPQTLASVTELHCDGGQTPSGPITSLAGVDQLTALTNLDAPRNAISDLSPLAGTRLSTLTLTDNDVSDLSRSPGCRCSTSGSRRTRSPTSRRWRGPRRCARSAWRPRS